MNGKLNAIGLALLMIASALAGCTSGDPDSGGSDEINAEVIQNLQDFFNNTSVGSDSVMNMFTVSWDREDILLGFDPENDLIELPPGTTQWSEQDPTLFLVEEYNGQVIEFRMSCLEYLYHAAYSQYSWEDWLEDNYGSSDNSSNSGNSNSSGDSNNNGDSNNTGNSSVSNRQGTQPTNIGYRIWWWFNYGIDDDIQRVCQIGEYKPTSRAILFEIDLEIGEAMSIQVIPPYIEVDLNCDDGYGTGIGNGTSTSYIGGQANCTVTGSTAGIWQITYNEYLYDENGSHFEEYNVNFYNWFVHYSSIAPENFAVYFTMHNVEVYELE
tara:strand:+ start:418 stop:1392 length:975 start_codon:yes stop_codon:yes gene_type:complete